ncbi:toxin-activating lysine-acyltransferase [Phaeodactylibacter sp.]|uniref:toxin-activating lysine-acyltransferase n=1 Tax=Phaeodactylibacter sp. TaxID=1940289 RepID=UPI0025FF29E3|nr:toxin-activating lysine-acyltransferase [Phaeodactylibacter sp.]MCI4649477.1 toxin-activating lysine-acyltransferase [Phaeodactylibacter sp.]MCI5091200.1 toxin-activating lysine-acyltransferase [Phaeodactylibacter sp.]
MVKQTQNVHEGVLNKLPPEKLNLLIGEVTSLLMLSKVHRKMQIRDISDIVLPPVHLNQFRIYRNSKEEPIGLVTWGWFSDEIEKKYLSGDVVLTFGEWNSGKNLFFTDFIAPFGHAKKIFKDLTHNIFPDETAKTLRFDDHGKHRKNVIHLYGKNVRN